MKTFIHVNQHHIRSNKMNGTKLPVITIKRGRKNTYCNEVQILGPSKVLYATGEKPLLSCGARVAVVTEAPIEVIS